MSAGTIVLWRHGRTEYNAAGRLQGQVDIPLDDVGSWQSLEGARALATRVRPAKIVSSDLVRAADTAAALGDETGADVVLDERVRERNFGAWEGMSGDEIAERWPQEFKEWRAGLDPVREGGESRGEVGERMVRALTEHAGDLDADDTLVIVTHGAAIAIAVTAMLGIDPDTWKGIQGVNNAHWSVLKASKPGAEPAWRLTEHNIGPDFPLEHWNAGPDWKLQATSA